VEALENLDLNALKAVITYVTIAKINQSISGIYMCTTSLQWRCVMHAQANNGNQIFAINSSTITLYLPSLSVKSQHTLDINCDSETSCISYQDRMFIASVGIQFYEFNVQNGLIALGNALISKKWMGLCGIKNSIYNVGGFVLGEGKSINNCEKYDIKYNKWTKLPNLIKERHCMAAFAFNNKWVYAFKGNRFYIPEDTIERIEYNGNEWKFVNPTSCDCPSKFDMYGIQISKDSILLFGDYYEPVNKEAYIMKISKQGCVVQKSTSLTRGGKFNSTTAPMIISGKVYAVDYHRNIHVYDLLRVGAI